MTADSESDHGTIEGPWLDAVWFYIPGPVRSKSNYRNARSSRESWRTHADFTRRAAVIAAAARPLGWPGLTGANGAPLSFSVVVVSRSLLDTGNVSKSVLDAWEGVLFPNDRDVASLTEVNMRGRNRQGMVCAVACLPPGETDSAYTHHVQLFNETMALAQAQQIVNPQIDNVEGSAGRG